MTDLANPLTAAKGQAWVDRLPKKGTIVKDTGGNHFIVLKPGVTVSTVESVATRETFRVPNSELFESDRVTF